MTLVNLWKPRQTVSPPSLGTLIFQRLFVRIVENLSAARRSSILSFVSSTFINRIRASFSILLHRILWRDFVETSGVHVKGALKWKRGPFALGPRSIK